VYFAAEGGKAVRFLGVTLDITESKKAEDALRQAQKLESIGVLAGGIAHDFNNLLVGVIGNASLAQDSLPPGSPAAEILQRVVESGEQAAQLTRQMLAYAGKGRFLFEPVDIPAMVREAAALIQSSISKRISLSLDLDAATPAVDSDRSQMQQVFMNLALNAAEAIGSGPGEISIRTGEAALDAAQVREHLDGWPAAPGRFAFLEVKDTGCGMAAATAAKIFDPFFTTKFQGRGLGLAAVAGIVRAHRGAIRLTTAPGQGATFRVLLPAAAAPAAVAPPPAPHSEALAGSDDSGGGRRGIGARPGPAIARIVRLRGAGGLERRRCPRYRSYRPRSHTPGAARPEYARHGRGRSAAAPPGDQPQPGGDRLQRL
jgi:signal transduction histidine kinase